MLDGVPRIRRAGVWMIWFWVSLGEELIAGAHAGSEGTREGPPPHLIFIASGRDPCQRGWSLIPFNHIQWRRRPGHRQGDGSGRDETNMDAVELEPVKALQSSAAVSFHKLAADICRFVHLLLVQDQIKAIFGQMKAIYADQSD